MQISKVFKYFCDDKKLLNYSIHTLKAYKIQCNLLIRYLGDIDIEEIQLNNLKEYLLTLSHLKPSSLGHRIRFLRSFFKFLQDDGYLERNIAVKLKEPKLGMRVPKALNDEEIEFLRDSCSTLLEKALTEFFYSTGCRIGEVHNLNIKDINWNNRSALVLGKGSKQREVYFTSKCKIWLRKYLQSRNDNCESLFVTVRKPIRRMSIARLREVVKEIAKNSNIEINMFPHRWRHSMATTMLNNGAPLEVIASNLGHVKISTTMLYCQLSGERRRQEYNKYFR